MARLILSEHGKALWTLVLPKDASEAQLKIASMLRSYLKKLSGATFPLRRDNTRAREREICIGATDRAHFSFSGRNCEEHCRIVLRGETLHLIGGGDRGTMYAVNTFLELLGVRFFTPDCERIPKLETLTYDHEKDLNIKPIVEFRDENWYMSKDPVWCEKQKINARGSELPIAGGKGYFGWFVHTMGALAEMTPPFMNTQPCLTDEKVYETVLKNVRKRFVDFPGNNIISVSQNDGTNADAVCKCERCRAINEREETLMGTTLYMANRIADAIREEQPDVLVDTLSYNFTTKAPKYMEPRDNVVIRFVTAFCCIHHALEDAKPSPGAGSEQKSIQFNENLLRWSSMAKHLYMWYYTTSFSNCLTPLPNLEAFRRDMRYLTDHHVVGFFLQGNADPDGEFGELRAYLAARLLWNPRMSKKQYYAEMAEFLETYYGDAAPFVRRYIDLLMKTDPDTHFHLYADPLQIYPPKFKQVRGKTVLDTSFVDHGKALWDAAENAVRSDKKRLYRVQKSRLQHLYYEINLRFAVLETNPDPKRELKELTRLNRKFYAALKRVPNVAMTEGRGAVRDNPDFRNNPLQWYSQN